MAAKKETDPNARGLGGGKGLQVTRVKKGIERDEIRRWEYDLKGGGS